MSASSPVAEEAGSLTRAALAERFGIGAGTLLYYERIGLLPPPRRSPVGYRLYARADLDRIRFIAMAKALGCSLREIAVLLRGAAEGWAAERLRAGIVEKAEALQREIDELESRRRTLLELAANPGLGECDSLKALRAK